MITMAGLGMQAGNSKSDHELNARMVFQERQLEWLIQSVEQAINFFNMHHPEESHETLRRTLMSHFETFNNILIGHKKSIKHYLSDSRSKTLRLDDGSLAIKLAEAIHAFSEISKIVTASGGGELIENSVFKHDIKKTIDATRSLYCDSRKVEFFKKLEKLQEIYRRANAALMDALNAPGKISECAIKDLKDIVAKLEVCIKDSPENVNLNQLKRYSRQRHGAILVKKSLSKQFSDRTEGVYYIAEPLVFLRNIEAEFVAFSWCIEKFNEIAARELLSVEMFDAQEKDILKEIYSAYQMDAAPCDQDKKASIEDFEQSKIKELKAKGGVSYSMQELFSWKNAEETRNVRKFLKTFLEVNVEMFSALKVAGSSVIVDAEISKRAAKFGRDIEHMQIILAEIEKDLQEQSVGDLEKNQGVLQSKTIQALEKVILMLPAFLAILEMEMLKSDKPKGVFGTFKKDRLMYKRKARVDDELVEVWTFVSKIEKLTPEEAFSAKMGTVYFKVMGLLQNHLEKASRDFVDIFHVVNVISRFYCSGDLRAHLQKANSVFGDAHGVSVVEVEQAFLKLMNATTANDLLGLVSIYKKMAMAIGQLAVNKIDSKKKGEDLKKIDIAVDRYYDDSCNEHFFGTRLRVHRNRDYIAIRDSFRALSAQAEEAPKDHNVNKKRGAVRYLCKTMSAKDFRNAFSAIEVASSGCAPDTGRASSGSNSGSSTASLDLTQNHELEMDEIGAEQSVTRIRALATRASTG